MAGERSRVKLFVMRSRYSGKAFVRAYPWERQEMFFDAHMRAFASYQGIFRQLVYDNLSPAGQETSGAGTLCLLSQLLCL